MHGGGDRKHQWDCGQSSFGLLPALWPQGWDGPLVGPVVSTCQWATPRTGHRASTGQDGTGPERKKESALALLRLQPSPEGHASAGVRHGRHHRRDDDGRGKKDRDGQPVIFLWCLQLPPLSRAAGGHVGPILSSNSATTVPAKNRSPTETPSQANTQTAVRIHSRILTPVWRHGSTVGALAAMVAVLLIAVMA